MRIAPIDVCACRSREACDAAMILFYFIYFAFAFAAAAERQRR